MSASTTVMAAMVAQRKRLIRHFVAAAAFTPQSGVTAESLPRAGFRLVPKLKEQGVILSAPDGRLYLDRARWESISQARQVRLKIAALVALAVLIGGLASAYFAGAA